MSGYSKTMLAFAVFFSFCR